MQKPWESGTGPIAEPVQLARFTPMYASAVGIGLQVSGLLGLAWLFRPLDLGGWSRISLRGLKATKDPAYFLESPASRQARILQELVLL